MLTKSQNIYWMFINSTKKNYAPNCIKKWENIYNIDHELWPQIFLTPFSCCRETYLQSFQYRIIHRILPCNYWLKTITVIDKDICTYKYCQSKQQDTIQHYLIECAPVQAFWQSFVTWWNNLKFCKLYPLVEENIVLGFPGTTNEDIVLNFCLILAKHYIYSIKRHQSQLFFLNYLNLLKNKLTIEYEIQQKNASLSNFYRVWGYLMESL